MGGVLTLVSSGLLQKGSTVPIHGLLSLAYCLVGGRGSSCSHVVHCIGFSGRAWVVGRGFTCLWHGRSTGHGRL